MMGSPRYVGFVKPEWGLSRALKMWGVSVPPESPTMKVRVGKVSRSDVYKLYANYG
ncbi:hypothetical protein [Thermococcus sibiricus]|uniref:hypothetical protein n=1 Tax=Thermococcus sibiricus TaxID=172049 RepID=UPI0024B60BB6|nr:hypothetical protein [Thermococcus sibiricus]